MEHQQSELADIKNWRAKLNENQRDFWDRFWVTQPGGSRYESGQPIPRPLAILMALFYQGRISEQDIFDAKKLLECLMD